MTEIIQGDTAEPMPVTLSINGTPEPVDTVLETVQMRWTKPDGTTSTVALAAVDAALGQFKYTWVAGDTSQIGVHKGQPFTTKAGKTESYRPIYWWVVRALGNEG